MDRPRTAARRRGAPSRRDVLACGLSAAAVTAPLVGCGSGAGASDLTVSELADGLVLIAGAGGNVVAARGPDGAILVDGGDARHAEALVRAATRATGARRVAALFNTHWHPEQTGANERLGGQGAPIIAHENTRLWLGTEVWVRWRDRTYAPLPEEARPTDTIYTSAEMELGDERVEYGYLIQAHTDGDIYVFFREANVLVAGGVAAGAGWPIIDWSTGGWYGGMIDALGALRDLADESTIIVPADGPVLTRADLETQIAMHEAIMQKLADGLRASLSPDEIVASAPTAEYDAELGDPELFLRLAFESLWGHVRSDPRVRAI